MSLLMWIGVGSIVGYAAALARADWDVRRRRVVCRLGGHRLSNRAVGVRSCASHFAIASEHRRAHEYDREARREVWSASMHRDHGLGSL